MGTNQGGVNCYNGSNFSYVTTENGLSDNVVYAINEYNDRILLGTNNGLTIIRGLDTLILGIENGLPHQGVVSILVSDDNVAWLGTGKGVAKLVGDSIHTTFLDSSLARSTVLNIREGTDGSIWFCTVQNGVFRWNGNDIKNISTENGLGHNYVFDVMPLGSFDAWIFSYVGLYRLKGEALEQLTDMPSRFPKRAIYYGYARDQVGNIWVGTSAGVLKYHDGKFSLLTTDNGLVNNNIWKVLHDREGNIWFGSKSNGVSKLTSERFKLYNSENDFPDEDVTAVMRASDGKLWLGTHRGVAVWDSTSKVFYHQENGLSSETIRDFAEDERGDVYIATNYGLSIYRNGMLQPFEMEVNNLNDCHDVFVDGDRVWFGTKIGAAILEDGKLVQPYNASRFSNYVFDAARKGNDIWFAYDDGVLKFDGQRFVNLKKSDGFFDGRTRSLVVGPNGNLWFGTNSGVYVYNGDSCRNISVNDGLISDAVYSLCFDAAGDLWVGQSKGLVRIMFDGSEIKDVLRYGRPQGFLGIECHTNSIWADNDGTVWVGTGNGLVEYDPKYDKGLFYKPKTRITSLKLFSQETDWSEFTDSVSLSGVPFNPELPYHRNHLTFEFSGVSLTAPISMNYSYMLEGLDDEWSPITNDNKAVYTNVPPGKYTFRVRAGFGHELWKNDPVSLSLEIRAPFYKTNWFYAICALILIGIAYSYYTIRKANTQILKQKQQIESQKEVIEKKNQGMVDSINYASTIQTATLPSEEMWFQHLPNSFVLYLPKDIVSGDFYWMTTIGDDVFFAAVDCTGHGVPGALMSIIGYNGLNKAVKELGITKPSEILLQLSLSVNESLRKSERDDYVKDGMDIALCKLNKKTRKLEFAGSMNPCLIVRNGHPILMKGDRISIGSLDSTDLEFTNHEMKLEPADSLFIYSDGYADQFGGTNGKKLKAKTMRDKLVEVASLAPEKQYLALERFLTEWRGELAQVDDVCVIGVKV